MAGIQHRSDTLLCTAACTPTFCLLWLLLGITGHASHQQTLLLSPLLLMELSRSQREAQRWQCSSGLVPPHHWGAEGAQLGCCMLVALTAGMLSPQQNLPCQDDDPSLHASQIASLFQAAHGERAPEGPVLHRFGLPVTVLQRAWAVTSQNCSKGAGYMPVAHGTGM